jgi:hypothetical protein
MYEIKYIEKKNTYKNKIIQYRKPSPLMRRFKMTWTELSYNKNFNSKTASMKMSFHKGHKKT